MVDGGWWLVVGMNLVLSLVLPFPRGTVQEQFNGLPMWGERVKRKRKVKREEVKREDVRRCCDRQKTVTSL